MASTIQPSALALAGLITFVAATAGVPTAKEMDCLAMDHAHMVTTHMGRAVAPILHKMKMLNGSIVSPDGTVIMANGSRLHLKNGDMIMMDGHVMSGGPAKPMEK